MPARVHPDEDERYMEVEKQSFVVVEFPYVYILTKMKDTWRLKYEVLLW